jgi:hypothetical protein
MKFICTWPNHAKVSFQLKENTPGPHYTDNQELLFRKHLEGLHVNVPTDAIPNLLWWWGLRAPEALRAMPAVA